MCAFKFMLPSRQQASPVKSEPVMRVGNRQRGAIAILTAALLILLLGIAALAIDVGRLYVVRNELQNAADAAALTGAGYFYPGPPVPNWPSSQAKAMAAISLNKSSGFTLEDGVVQVGYWNVTGTPAGLQPLPMTPGPNDLPAVMVTINRASGSNNGAVVLYLARLFGVPVAPVGASAVAVVSYPGYFLPGGLIPVVLSSCLYNNYWDKNANPPGPKIDPGTGKPYVFQIGSSYHYGVCDSGQWTSFQVDTNNTPTMQNLITNGNPTTLHVGDPTWVEPGTKNTLFDAIDACSARGNRKCEYVVAPIVSDVVTHASSPIIAFACMHIDLAVGGSQKYIQVEMSTKCSSGASGGSGTYYGVVTPAQLVQ